MSDLHRPALVYFDAEKLRTPAEVCGTCSNAEAGTWVPVTQCPISAARMTDDPIADAECWVFDRSTFHGEMESEAELEMDAREAQWGEA
jgi:hypothetical protein